MGVIRLQCSWISFRSFEAAIRSKDMKVLRALAFWGSIPVGIYFAWPIIIEVGDDVRQKMYASCHAKGKC